MKKIFFIIIILSTLTLSSSMYARGGGGHGGGDFGGGAHEGRGWNGNYGYHGGAYWDEGPAITVEEPSDVVYTSQCEYVPGHYDNNGYYVPGQNVCQ